MAAASSSNLKIYQFKITLKDSHVWRCIEIPENYTFPELHIALQDMFELSNHKWHKFEMGTATSLEMGKCIGKPCEFLSIIPERDERISTQFNLANIDCVYTHLCKSGRYVKLIITLDVMLKGIPDIKYPRCIAGGQQYPIKLGKFRRRKFSAKQITFRDAKETSDSDNSVFSE